MNQKNKIPFSDLSKKVGWDNRKVSFPKNSSEIKKASDEQIVEWFRFCSIPKNEKQIVLINEISKRFKFLAGTR